MSTYNKVLQYKTLAIIYASGIVLYNAAGSYDGAMQTLKRFEAKTPYGHESHLTTQWDAVKYGSNYHSVNRFLNSIIFPITAINDMIPIVVLKLHGK